MLLHPRYSLLCILFTLAIASVPPLATAQEQERDPQAAQVEALQQENDTLRQRVAELELKLADAGIPTDGSGTPATGEPAMAAGAGRVNWGMVQEIKRVEPEVAEGAQQRVEELRQEVDRLRDEQVEARQDVAEADVKTASNQRGLYDSGANYDDDNADAEIARQLEQTRDEVRAEGVEASGVADQLRRKQQELRRAQRAMQPHQEVVVTREGKTITLEATDTGTNAVEVEPAWAAVRWTGELISSDGTTERWEARKIEPLTEEALQRLQSAGRPSPVR